MILQALVDLAERKRLIAEDGYAPRRIHFQLRIRPDGAPVALVPLGALREGLEMLVPAAPRRSGGISPAFLVDSATYLLSVPKCAKDGSAPLRAIMRARECFRQYSQMVIDAATFTVDPGLQAAANFVMLLRSTPECCRAVTLMATCNRWTGDEQIALSLDSDIYRYIHERSAVRQYWSMRTRLASSKAALTQCLATGAIASPVRIHRPIKRIPGSHSAGASLVSFASAAFTSQRLTQGDNAPICHKAADAYICALNYLLERHGSRTFRGGLTIGVSSALLCWTGADTAIGAEVLSFFAPSADSVVRDSDSFRRTPLSPSDPDSTPFYALVLSGRTSRIVVRDWIHSTVGAVRCNVRRFFSEFALDDHAPHLSLARMLFLLRDKPRADIYARPLSDALLTRLIRLVIDGSALGWSEILRAALTLLRFYSPIPQSNETFRARLSLVKAALIRLQTIGHPDLKATLDFTNSQSIAYLLGRLFAMIEHCRAGVRRTAHVPHKRFAAALQIPQSVFPQLLRDIKASMQQASIRRPCFCETAIDEIVRRLPAERFPAFLKEPDQGLFVLGYYHQSQTLAIARRTCAAHGYVRE